LLAPGPNYPVGFILTTVLGIVGAVLATVVGQAIGWDRPGQSTGLIGAVIGAVVLLLRWHPLGGGPSIGGPGPPRRPLLRPPPIVGIRDRANSTDPDAHDDHRDIVLATRRHGLNEQRAQCLLVARPHRGLDLGVAQHVGETVAADEPARGNDEILGADVRGD